VLLILNQKIPPTLGNVLKPLIPDRMAVLDAIVDARGFASELSSIPVASSSGGEHANRVLKLGKRTGI
jgi:hypothetical protein